MAWEKRLTVRFDDVDFAQLVYFPRLFVFCHWAFEDFFADQVGVPYAQMLQKRRVGYPAVHTESDFKAPLRFGDPLRIVLDTVRLGTRSLTNRYQLFHAEQGTLCAQIQIVTASISMDTYASVDLPDDVRAAFAKHTMT